MRFYLIKTPRIIKKIFFNYTWCFSSKQKEVYLTFDDGPTPEVTSFVLDVLKKYNANATFFCIGKNIDNHPELFKRIMDEGHTIGNHTQNHFNGWKHSVENYLMNVETCERAMQKFRDTTSEQKRLFRPPYGKIKASQARELKRKGYEIIMWDVLSADFDTRISKEQCLKNVFENVENGSVVVFHDSVKASERLCYALPKVLEKLSEKGFSFKAI
ncbi:polysaccharide deacetylase family protein [uncultured Tenacibaculum sp.]|uniref:polysaccharide deacetylase family protein n=1 Tax=uncultured Tenacibaculum sp. TaxID=174713 RepID=UPI002623CF4C|nr:polysaccharide deacetylase family protein [uncultured Tenacibaculum sp.]